MKQFQRVEVIWEDVVSDASWRSIEDCMEEKGTICKTVGYLLKKHPDRIVLAHSMNDSDADSTVIMRKYIHKVTRLNSGGVIKL